ncbi:hypothetical protein EPN44_15070 [bacterium]|nr:MAG: hypothetical protein EPN44_15070 [bacterium]
MSAPTSAYPHEYEPHGVTARRRVGGGAPSAFLLSIRPAGFVRQESALLHPENAPVMILVLGSTRLGARLVKALRAASQEVTIVERNRRYLEQYLSDDHGATVVLGSPTDPDVLQRAGVERADVICVANRDDALNVLLADLLRARFPSKRILVRLDDPALTQVFREGGSEVVSPLDLAVTAFTHSIVPITERV